jgi:hypothetical protein
MLFICLLAFGVFFNTKPKWFAGAPNLKAEPLSQWLGASVGSFTALLWLSAIKSFWNELVDSGGGFGGPIANVIDILPVQVLAFIPSLIAIFVLTLVVIMLFNLPKLWKA